MNFLQRARGVTKWFSTSKSFFQLFAIQDFGTLYFSFFFFTYIMVEEKNFETVKENFLIWETLGNIDVFDKILDWMFE